MTSWIEASNERAHTEQSGGYALRYRSFDHRSMGAACRALQQPVLGSVLRRPLGRTAVSRDMRDFARTFPILQDARHLADYDPATVFVLADVTSLIDAADVAMAAFDRVDADEQADVLALLMVKPWV